MKEKDYYGAIKGFCLKWNLPEVWNSDRITGANLIYEVIKVINAMIIEQKAMKEMIEEFLRMFDEDLSDTVKDQLTVWLIDGTLGDIINETLFNSKLDVTVFNTHVTEQDVINTGINNSINNLNTSKLDTSVFETYKTYNEDLNTVTIDKIAVETERINVLRKDFNENKKYLNIKTFGAVGDGVTDDTASFLSAISFINDNIPSVSTNNSEIGYTLFIPNGKYLIKDTLLIEKNSVAIVGESISSSCLLFEGDKDGLHFYNPSFALTNCQVSNLRIESRLKNTGTGIQLIMDTCFNSIISNVSFYDGFVGVKLLGCAKLFMNNILIDLANRTGTNQISLQITESGTRARAGDIHVSDLQIFKNFATQGAYSVLLSGADGIYFNNVHMHGGILCEPSLSNSSSNSMASIVISNLYVDNASDCGISFTGLSTHYKDIRIVNSYFRQCVVGVRINTKSVLHNVYINGCNFSDNTYIGLDIDTITLKNSQIIGCIFTNNGEGVDVGSLNLRGNNIIVSSCIFAGTDNATYGVRVNTNASYIMLNGLSFIDKAGTKLDVKNGALTLQNAIWGL